MFQLWQEQTCVCVCLYVRILACICALLFQALHINNAEKPQVQSSKTMRLYLNIRRLKYIYLALKDCCDTSLIASGWISASCSIYSTFC